MPCSATFIIFSPCGQYLCFELRGRGGWACSHEGRCCLSQCRNANQRDAIEDDNRRDHSEQEQHLMRWCSGHGWHWYLSLRWCSWEGIKGEGGTGKADCSMIMFCWRGDGNVYSIINLKSTNGRRFLCDEWYYSYQRKQFLFQNIISITNSTYFKY